MNKLSIICFILAVLSLIPFAMVLTKRSRQKKFMAKAVSTTALVTHCEKRHGLKGAVYYVVSLQYSTKDGKQIQTHSIFSKKRAPGDTVPLMYLQDEPATFSTDFGTKMPLAIAATLVFFVAMALVCCWLINQE